MKGLSHTNKALLDKFITIVSYLNEDERKELGEWILYYMALKQG